MGGISQGAMDDGAVMYRMYCISQGAMDGGAMNVHGWAVCRKEPGMAMRRMFMDGWTASPGSR